MKKIKIILLILQLLYLSSCSSVTPTSYIGQRHQPILCDGSRIYGGMGTDILSYVSTLSNTYGPLCSNPTCTHTRDNSSCEARATITINAFTLSNDGNIIISGRDPSDPYTYSSILINPETGKHEYIIKQNPNNINAMLVINDTLFFLSQIDDGDSNEGEHVVCYVPLSGGKINSIALPENDYYFAGADTKYLYLKGEYNRSILAVDYNNNFTYTTLYTFNESESTDCFISNDIIYTFTNRTNKTIIPNNNTTEFIDAETITQNYTTYSLSKYSLSSKNLLGTTTSQYQSTPWGTIFDNSIYLPHFSPSIDSVNENNDKNNPYPIHKNPGIDIIDLTSMELVETIEIPNTNVIAIVYADAEKIVYYCNRYENRLMYYMGWYEINTGTTHEFSVDWNDQIH